MVISKIVRPRYLFGTFGRFYSLLTGRYNSSQSAIQVFTEDEPHEIGFAEHYEKHLKPRVVEFENARIAALKEARSRLFKMLPVMGTALIFATYAGFVSDWPDEAREFSVLGLVGVLVVGGWWFNRTLGEYQASIKSDIFPIIVSFLGDYKYTAEIDDRIDQYDDFGIVSSHDSEYSEDQIVGTYKGVEIDLFETHLTKKSGSGKNRRTVTVFKGIVISLSLNKTFEGKTIVKKDRGRLVNWVSDKFSSLEAVNLEDPRFEKEFEVYSTDQVEARYLLTTSFMERLVGLREAFGGQGIQCSFYQNQLLMMISIKRDMFEPGSIFEHEDFVDDAKSLLKEMNIIFQIVDTLHLDLDVGL
ncbi:MAG: DUF3137 domain-containing protein [Pseudomonadota bacterium]|nr:DUF3137 domain-containing protein [Pseudomonadota bacterium]